MNPSPLILAVSFRWWVMPYINTLKFFAWCFDLEVDVDKMVDKIMSCGIRIRAVR